MKEKLTSWVIGRRHFSFSAYNNAPEYGMFGFDREADINAARLVNAVLFSRTIPEEEAEKPDLALHYLYGSGVGLCYAAFAARSSQLRAGGGTSFGAALWLLGDEIPAAALAAHLLLRVVVEQVFARAHRS
jgi:hypothetical protein